MTRDKVTLRLTLSVEYAVEDAALATTRVANVRDALYLAVQLAARDFVAGVTLDELLEGRDAMTKHLEGKVVPQSVKLPLATAEDPNFKDGENYYSKEGDNFFVGNSFPTCGINFTAQEIMGQNKTDQ